MTSAPHLGFVFADGSRLMAGFPGRSDCWLIEGCFPVSCEVEVPYYELGHFGLDRFGVVAPKRQSVSLTIRGTCGISSVSFEDGLKLFQTAATMSVNELLAAAFEKMNDRAI